MSRHLHLAAVVALALASGACAPNRGPISAANNPSLYSVHQPVVQRTDYVLDLATSGEGLPPSEMARLDAWLASIGAAYGDRIFVDEAGGYGNPEARADVAQVAGNYGLLLDDGAPVLGGTVPPGAIRVVASRAVATVPGCPAWRQTPEIEVNVNTSSNYGCAINSNIAAMVANPDDLVLGQSGSTTGGAATATRAIRSHRGRAPTGAQPLPTTTTTGNQ